jgi:hypothetical protein
MDTKTFSIGILSITAVILFVANLIVPQQQAAAQITVKDSGYSVATSRVQTGGDGLYIVDNGTGLMAVFTWDPASRTVRPRAVKDIGEAFMQR